MKYTSLFYKKKMLLLNFMVIILFIQFVILHIGNYSEKSILQRTKACAFCIFQTQKKTNNINLQIIRQT